MLMSAKQKVLYLCSLFALRDHIFAFCCESEHVSL